ncbi:MAG: SMP-30/gluconolactonase/LRE family protein [Pseudomonadota bacterium]
MSAVFDDSLCKLGEGPLWHPVRQQLFWFDIDGKQMITHQYGSQKVWQFDENVSAAGWIDAGRILIASESGLYVFTIETGVSELLVKLEAETTATRSNDGRADPWGGFWIGTMGKNAEPDLGAIYRYYQGALTKLYVNVTIPNAICFSPDRRFAYYTDTAKKRVMRQALRPTDGMPDDFAELWLDLREEALNPDGAVIDTDGRMWLAQWGAGRVACYDENAQLVETVEFPARHTSCPAFGGADLKTLYCTSAAIGVSKAQREAEPTNGMTFAVKVNATGQKEHQVIL